MRPKDADKMANSVDPDQNAQEQSAWAVWSGSMPFVKTCLSKNLEALPD